MIRISWQSPGDAQVVFRGLTAAGFQAVAEDEDPDCVVLDVRSFHNIKAAMARYHELATPSLVVVDSHAQETAVLPQLRPGDDVCLAETLAVQGPVRLRRIIASASEGDETATDISRQAPSFLDLLTGLENRHAFYLHYFESIRDCGPLSPLSLLMMDIDQFKEVNDRLGHEAGDKVLSAIGETLRTVCRGAAGMARFGGDEFVVALREDQKQAERLAEFILAEISGQVFHVDDEEVSISVSIGVATSDGNYSGEELLKEADTCLYAAKAGGRNRVVSSSRSLARCDDPSYDPAVEDFENRVRVLTERLIRGVAARGKSMAQSLREEADHDGLTGLYIRRYFDRRMEREFEKSVSRARPLSLIFLDIDHFGQVNKTHGFPSGDRALRYVAGVLKDSVRVVDWVARYGGEELCVVLPDTSLEDAMSIAERIRKRIEGGHVTAYDGTRFSLTASLGVGSREDSDTAVVDFVQRVSDKTREAKNAGRNAVRS